MGGEPGAGVVRLLGQIVAPSRWPALRRRPQGGVPRHTRPAARQRPRRFRRPRLELPPLEEVDAQRPTHLPTMASATGVAAYFARRGTNFHSASTAKRIVTTPTKLASV